MKQLRTVSDFHAAIDSGYPVVVIDAPTKQATLHRHPAECRWITVENFERKVMEGAGANGSYWSASDELPFETRECSKCSPGHGNPMSLG